MKGILAIISSIGATIWSGYVLSVLWMWFVVATFFAAPVLTVPAAIGLTMLVRLMTYKVHVNDCDKDNVDLQCIIHWLMPTVAIIGGFVVHLFM